MPEIPSKIAGLLLESKAVILQPFKPFTWASGWKSPIYCDNRVTLSYPAIRSTLKEAFIELIREHFKDPDCIAGVATGAIAQGALVAEQMGLPFVYVRSSAKEHGRKNLVEGRLEKGARVVVVEDLVSTGGSSLKAVEAIRQAGGIVNTMVAIFTYGFPLAGKAFERAGVELFTLTDYPTLIERAREQGYVKPEQLEWLNRWREDPSGWGDRISGASQHVSG